MLRDIAKIIFFGNYLRRKRKYHWRLVVRPTIAWADLYCGSDTDRWCEGCLRELSLNERDLVTKFSTLCRFFNSMKIAILRNITLQL